MYLLKSHIKTHTRISASGTLSQVRQHEDKRVKKPVAAPKPALSIGQEVYFKPEGGTKRRWGTVVGGDKSAWQIEGKRQGGSFKPETYLLPRHQIWTKEEYAAETATPGTREMVAGNKWLIPAAELNRRAALAASRFEINEKQIMEHPAINEQARQTLAGLAHSNGINSRYTIRNGTLHNDDLEAMELYSEYATAMMGALRREVSAAPQADLDEFRQFLNGESQKSRISATITWAGRGAAIRYLKDREKKKQELTDFQEMENDPGMRREMLGNLTTPPEHESESAQEKARDKMIAAFVAKLPPVEAEIIQRKYGLGDYDEPQGNETISDALNDAGQYISVKAGEQNEYTGQIHPKDGTVKWTRNHVSNAHKVAIENLKDIHGTNALRGFVKSVLEIVTLRKSGGVITVDSLKKSYPAAICSEVDGHICMMLTDELHKSYSSDLMEKYPGGKWITVREGALAGRHIFILPQRDGSAKIVAGGGPFLKDKVLTSQQDPKQIGPQQPEKPEATDEPVTVQAADHDKGHKIPPPPDTDTSLKHSDENYRYRDIGHVPGSRKELAAAQATMIKQRGKSGAGVNHREINWDALEENPREAYDLITKETIAKEVDWEGMKAQGVEPGAGFLLSKLYSAVAPKPEDSAEARKDFVFGINALQERFEGAKTPEDVVNKIKEISEEMTGFLLNPEQQKEWDKLNEEYSAIAKERIRLRRESDASWNAYYRPERRLTNLKYDQEKRIRRGWKPDPELQKQIDDMQKDVDSFHEANNQWREKNGSALKEAEDRSGEMYRKVETFRKSVISKNILEHPLTRGWNSFGKKFFNAINYSSYKGSDAFGTHVATAKSGKVNDWFWLDKDTKPREASKRSVQFQLKIAEKAERIGGAALAKRDYSTEDLKKEFNLANVQSGNWVLKDLNAAKYHTEQCAMALQDMADVLGIPTKEVSLNGRLSIAFGARGSGGTFGPGAAAHYEPKYRVINLTKMNGGGSLAHEWFHSLDDIAGETESGERKGTTTFATSQQGHTEVLKAFQNLAFEMENGGHNETVQQKMTITESEKAHWLNQLDRAKKYNYYGPTYGLMKQIVDSKDLSEAMEKLLAAKRQGKFGAVDGAKAKKQHELFKQIAVAHHAGTEGIYNVAGFKAGSKFYVESQKIDAQSRNTDYWQSRKEMAARAFSAYISDKLHAAGRENTYLTSMADNKFYVLDGVKPYPEGEERVKINAAFDRMFDAIRKNDTLKKALERIETADKLRKAAPGVFLLRKPCV